jgi:hypothetical protein
LAVKVGELEVIHVGDVEVSDAHAGQGGEVYTTDSAKPYDTDATFPKTKLLRGLDQAQVSRKGSVVIELGCLNGSVGSEHGTILCWEAVYFDCRRSEDDDRSGVPI